MLELVGTEQLTLELGGSIAADQAQALAGEGLAPRLVAGRGSVGLLLFRMRGLRPRGLPLPGVDYGEALWRLAVSHDGEPAWLALRCDLDQAAVRTLGAWLVRYPVRRATIEADAADPARFVVSAAGGRLQATARPGAEEPAAEAPLPVLARSGGGLHRIPWREDPAPWRRAALCTIEDELSPQTLGAPVRWEGLALLHRGRVHRCGLARRIR